MLPGGSRKPLPPGAGLGHVSIGATLPFDLSTFSIFFNSFQGRNDC